jgi:hypothetical protein
MSTVLSVCFVRRQLLVRRHSQNTAATVLKLLNRMQSHICDEGIQKKLFYNVVILFLAFRCTLLRSNVRYCIRTGLNTQSIKVCMLLTTWKTMVEFLKLTL